MRLSHARHSRFGINSNSCRSGGLSLGLLLVRFHDFYHKVARFMNKPSYFCVDPKLTKKFKLAGSWAILEIARNCPIVMVLSLVAAI